MKDYTAEGIIVRGSRWPAVNVMKPVRITNAAGWPEGADKWTWQLSLSRTKRGGTPDLVLDAAAAILDVKTMILNFFATPAETANLPCSEGKLHVEITSDDGVDVNYYDCVAGTAKVRSAAGEG